MKVGYPAGYPGAFAMAVAALGAEQFQEGVVTKWSRSKERPFAPFNSEADAKRAIKRAKRWIKNQSRHDKDKPPSHIFQNAELVAFQFGDAILQ